MVDEEDLKLVHYTHDAKEAIKIVTDFYRNFHSMRYIKDLLVFRIKRPLSKGGLAALSEKASAVAGDRYDWERITDRYVELFERMMGR